MLYQTHDDSITTITSLLLLLTLDGVNAVKESPSVTSIVVQSPSAPFIYHQELLLADISCEGPYPQTYHRIGYCLYVRNLFTYG